jgi:long-chain acyl-CoA synthetase
LTELFDSAARESPDEEFLLSLSLEEESRTFGEYNDEAKAVARSLLAQGVKTGDRVAILCENRPRWCVAYAAILHAGAIVVAIDAQTGPEAIQAVLDDSGSVGLFVSAELAGHLPALRERGFEGLVFGLDEDGAPSPWSQLSAGAEAELPQIAGGDAEAAVLYTSGTTGSPKGVVLTHANLQSLVMAVDQALAFRPDDRLLMFLPLQHVLSQVGSFILPAALRLTVVHAVIASGEELVRTVREGRVTILLAVPLFFHVLHDRIERGVAAAPALARSAFRSFLRWNGFLRRRLGLNLGRLFFRKVHALFGPQLRFMVSGASALDGGVESGFRAMGFDLIQAYGMTETSGGVTVMPLSSKKTGVVGAPLPGATVRIAAPDDAGVGEVLLRGPMITPGYHDRPEATAELLAGGWLHTGDLGRFDDEGFLQITGRSKDVIILGSGKNIYPEDLEVQYSRSPWIEELCVLGIDGGEQGEKLHAVVVPDWAQLKREGISGVREVIRFELETVSAQLPPYQRVLSFELRRDPLPRTPTRKVQRFKILPHQETIEERRASLPADGPEQVARLESEAGRTIIELIRGRIGEELPLQASSAFELDLGLDSLSRMELLLSIERALEIGFEDDEAAELATVDDLLQLAEAKRAAGAGGGARAGGWPELIAEAGPEDLPELLRERRSFLSYCGLQLMVWTAHLINLVFFRLRSTGIENAPKEGAFLVCPNHVSFLDGFLVASLFPRSVVRHAFVLGEADHVESGLAGGLSRFGGIVPTNPNLHLRLSMRAGAAGLKDGRVLMVFPEGTRSADGKLQDLKQGSAILATELDLPIVPALIEGAFDAWPRGASRPRLFTPCKVSFGKPIQPAEIAAGLQGEAAYAKVTERLREGLIELGAKV